MGMFRSVTCVSSRVGAWVACRGPGGDAGLLGRLLGPSAEMQTGTSWGLGYVVG